MGRNRDLELARALYPKPSDVVSKGIGTRVQSGFAHGTAVADSDSGTVSVVLYDSENVGEDAAMTIPTSCAISEGDEVLVTVNGNVPVEAVAAGSGDAIRDYVRTHLSLDDDGLWVTADGSDYALLVASDGIEVVDLDGGDVIATFGADAVVGRDWGYQSVVTDEGFFLYSPDAYAQGMDPSLQISNVSQSPDFPEGMISSPGLVEVMSFRDSVSTPQRTYMFMSDGLYDDDGYYAHMSDIPSVPPSMSVLSYGSSTWADFLAAYQTNTVVYCRASSNANPATGSQNRLAFMAYVNNADPSSITEVEFQYYRSVSTHSDAQQGDQVYVYKLKKTGGWSVTTREAYSRVDVGSGLSKSYASGTLTLSADTVLSTATASVVIPSTAHGSNAANVTGQATVPSGYSAIGVAGWTWASGTRQNWLNIYRLDVASDGTVTASACNTHASDAASGTMTVTVLLAKTTAIA